MTVCDDSPSIPNGITTDLARMISDNYMVMFIYFLIVGILLFFLFWILKDGFSIVFNYIKYRNVRNHSDVEDLSLDGNNTKDKKQDNEYYPIEEEQYLIKNPNTYRDKGYQDFIKNVQTAYKTYNTEKNKYISDTYNGRKNDDTIDDKIEYSKYDNYQYDEYRNKNDFRYDDYTYD